MDPVQPISPSLVDRSLGLDFVRSGPALRWRRAEAPAAPATPARPMAADQAGFSVATGLPAVSTQVQQAFSPAAQAAFAAPGVRAGARPPAAPAARPLGEDLAWIALANRSEPELKAMVQDPAVLALAEMALLEPGQRRLEREVKTWLGLGKPAAPPDSTEVDLLKVGIGAKVSGFSREQLAVEPNVDLVRLRRPDSTDLSLTAGVPINLHGQVHVRAQLQLQKGLDEGAARMIDTRARYDSQSDELSFRFGLRQRTGQDQALSIYGQHVRPLDSRPSDTGVGVYFSREWL